jgi:hypothetical protein
MCSCRWYWRSNPVAAVLLNLITNAIHAMADEVRAEDPAG